MVRLHPPQPIAMPLMTFCKYPGCHKAVPFGTSYCDKHKDASHRTVERKSAYARGYNRKWQRQSKEFLKRHPLCVECERNGRITPATEVDHIKPHKGNQKLFWDVTNWQPLCHSCHSRKTAKEDGGFANFCK